MKENIVIATIKEWNIKNYFKLKELYGDKYNFFLITEKEELTTQYLLDINPSYIFFPHWSWIIPQEIYDRYESIVFHMTDLPYGRGGSPLQNLIVRKVYDTKISALKVKKGMDTGAIYIKEDFNISIGSAEEVFIKLSNLIFFRMIPDILETRPKAKEQVGEPTVFKRRVVSDSQILDGENFSLVEFYDFVRMLDGEGYPKAFISINNLKIEFSEVHLKNGKLVGRFEVIENE